MTKFEVGYKGYDNKNHRFTFKSDKQLAYHANWNYGIGMPILQEIEEAAMRIEKRENTIMNKVGYKYPLYIKNLDTGYIVSIA